MKRRILFFCLLTGCAGTADVDATGDLHDDAAADAPVVPAELNCGDRREIALRFYNTGNTWWSAVAGYDLRSADGESIPLAETIAPKGSLSVVLPFRAPGDAGVHGSEWRVAKDGEPFGAATAWSLEVFCNRTPDPAPGESLPLPYEYELIQQIVEEDPTLIEQSCQDDENGNWRYLDTVVDRLRRVDTRWGYNWKRGVVGDPSRDVIDYHYGAGADEGSEEVYILDILVDHCGENPHPGWNDVTQATLDGGTIGVWTSRERFDDVTGS